MKAPHRETINSSVLCNTSILLFIDSDFVSPNIGLCNSFKVAGRRNVSDLPAYVTFERRYSSYKEKLNSYTIKHTVPQFNS